MFRLNKRRSAAVAMALTAAIFPGGAAVGLTDSSGVYSGVVRVLRDPMSILSDRSPGQRSNAGLVQSKSEYASAPEVAPRERVLPTARTRGGPGGIADPGEGPGISSGAGSPVGPVGKAGAPQAGALPDGSLPVPVPALPGSGASSGGIVPGGPLPPPFAPPIPSAVPEPSAWSMMIFGIGLVGAALRRRRHLPQAPRLG